MLNRRHLRIKILHALYAFYQSEEKSLVNGEKWLFKSILKFRELYIHLLLILKELREVALERIDTRRKKILATDQDLMPNYSFVDHPIMVNLNGNEDLKKGKEHYKLTWSDDKNEIVRAIYRQVEKEEDLEMILNSEIDLEIKKASLVRIFKKHIANNETIQHFFEEENVLWADDLDLASSMVVKTMKLFNVDEDPKIPLLDLYKDEKDEIHFIKELFKKTIELDTENEKLIQDKAKNWEVERIALIDMILMKMAIAEAKSFPTIPVKVTLNEYIELSKFYSTPKSSKFINGILDKLFQELKTSGIITKTGRGLIE